MPVDLPDLGLMITPKKMRRPMDDKTLYDLIIIGGGPAGLAGGVYASRKYLKTLLITKDLGGQLLWTSGIENYMGYQYITGADLSKKFSDQIETFPIDILMPEEVVGLRVDKENIFRVMTSAKKEFAAKSLVVASGKRYRSLGIPGEKELIGKGVAYCSTCDAPLFAGKDVAVIGGGNSALTAVSDLLSVANKIYVINILPALQADAALIERTKNPKVIYLFKRRTTTIKGQNKVEAITIENTDSNSSEELKVQGIFVEIGLEPNSEFVKGVLATNNLGEILIDCACKTNVAGVFAAGDVTNVAEKQIIVAAGEGAKASLSAYRYLLQKKG